MVALLTLFGLGGLIVAGGAVTASTGGGEVHPSTAPKAPAAALFHQCPAVGFDTGCALLIVINPDGSATVKSDPGQGAFDGIEDTLIGVQNNSSTTLASLPLIGTLAPFGFDGDGLCSGLPGPTPTGCPFGPTGYEGPNTSFSNISPSLNDGTVNFTGGLGSGKSAYFSLEGVVTPGVIHVGPPPGNIFESGFLQCAFLHIGYNRFTNGTVVHWDITSNGFGIVSTGQFTAIGGGKLGSKTYHFLTVPLGTTLHPEPVQSHIHLHWANGGNYAATRDPGC
jgi:hypothetical protein